MEKTNEEVVQDEPLIEEDLSALDDTTDWKAKAEELEQKRREDGIKQRERSKALKAQINELKTKEVTPKPEPKPVTGELDDTQLDYLDLKGITDEEDIAVIQKVMLKTGQTVRQALKDDYVVSKLKDLKVAREVKEATPSSTKRSGNQTNNLDYWVSKYEQTGELPTDFATRSAVINAKEAQNDVSKPKWQR
jgi:hypothetical protein